MPTEIRNLNANDRKTYDTWMRRTVLAYMALVVFGVALVSALAMTKAVSVDELDPGAIGMAAP